MNQYSYSDNKALNPFLIYLHKQSKLPNKSNNKIDDENFIDLMFSTYIKDMTRNLIDNFYFKQNLLQETNLLDQKLGNKMQFSNSAKENKNSQYRMKKSKLSISNIV